MPLATGTRLGTFEVLGPLGKGGMGEVYRARDTRLGREIAIKVLPAELAHDSERLARFEREARVLASLNHPNVATLHGFEREGAIGFLVMELVEGDTLAERIARGPLPWREAAALFEAIAEGLKAAHESGIVHRDLKPANVKIDPEGRVKLLDFGLARTRAVGRSGAARADSEVSTVTAGTTEEGVVLGTASYMSPEQARGAPVDRRADIWAFGCCLYEALAGQRPFAGESHAQILAAVLMREPDWGRLPAELPRGLTDLVRRCLEKDSRQRLQDIGDARWLLAEARRAPDERPEVLPARGRRRRAIVLGAAAAALALGAAGGWVASRLDRSEHIDQGGSPAVRFQVKTPLAVASFARARHFAVHPLGTGFAFAANGAIHWYDLAEGASRPIPGTTDGGQPFFSPDGEWLGFWRWEELAKVSASGGLAQRLCALPRGLPSGISWSGDRILFGMWDGPSRGLQWIPSTGGAPERLGDDPTLDRGTHPSFVADREAVLFASSSDDGDLAAQRLRVLDLSTGAVHDLGVEGRAPQYLSSGHLLWARDDDLWAARFDVERLRLAGEPWPVLHLPATSAPAAPYAGSPSGTVVTLEPDRFELVEIAADGGRRPLAAAPGWLRYPRYSPDGRYVAYARGGWGAAQIWIHEVASGRESRIADTRAQTYPVWTPDGRVVYVDVSGVRFVLRIATLDRRVEPTTLLESEQSVAPMSVSSDGILLFATGNEMRRVDLSRPGPGEPWLTQVSDHAAFSPDGRWVAYEDQDQVYVRPFPGPGGAQPVSADGGWHPTWGAGGRTIHFLSERGLEAIEVRVVGDDLELGASRVVGQLRTASWGRSYDPRPDGRGFVAAEKREEPASFTVVTNLGRILEGHARDGTASAQ